MRSDRRVLLGAIILLCVGQSVPARESGEDRPRLTDPNEYLENRVIIPLRVWDTRDKRFVDSPRWLRPDLFYIKEGSALQITRAVDQEQRPFSIALAVDISASMKDSLPAVRQAGRHMFDRLKPADQVTMLSFNHDVVVQTDLTNDRRELNRKLASLHSTGFTSLHDGIETALDLLEHRPDPRAIVVLTDGVDNRSKHYREEVLERAYRAKIPLFFIYHKVNPAGFRHLTEAAAHTGGKVFKAEDNEDLVQIFGAIADGLRRTILVAYRSGRSPDDHEWRELHVRHKFKRFQIHTWKTGYFPIEKADVSPLMGMGVPLHLPPPADTRVEQPVPRHICPPDFIGPLQEICPGGFTVRLTPDQPPGLEVRGWVDLAHDMGPMLHPTRYAGGLPIPEDPRDGEFRDWRFHLEYAVPETMTITLPRPDRLPTGTDAVWEQLFTAGATFRSMGMVEEQPDVYRPRELTATLPLVTGYAAASRDDDSTAAMDLWWPDGGAVTDLRKSFTSWLFRLNPDYRVWFRDRYEEATSEMILREYDTALARLPQPIPDRLRDYLATYVETNVRATRRVDWNRILDGDTLPSAHLLVRRRDIPAAEWFNDGDRLLLTRLLQADLHSPELLQQDWLVPARRTWSTLRSFLAPTSHRSLVIGTPFLDPEAGEIYLQRMILPWCGLDGGRPDCHRFPPHRPEGLELVAELLTRPDLTTDLGNGNYRCHGHCVMVDTHFSTDPALMPPRRQVVRETLRLERDRIQAIRQQLGAVEGAWLFEEKKRLDETIEKLQQTGVSVSVRLRKTGGEGTGLILLREDGGDPWAYPFKPVDMVFEIDDLSADTDFAAMAGESGYLPRSPEIESALLATRINRTTLADLRPLVGSGEEAVCRSETHFNRIRLLFRSDLIHSLRPAIIRRRGETRVLELNLVAGSLNQLRIALEDACRPLEPESVP